MTIDEIDSMLERLAIQEATLNVLMEAVDKLEKKLNDATEQLLGNNE